MCFGSQKTETVKPAEAPPAPEATPDEVIPSEESSETGNTRKTIKKKASGLSSYQTNPLSINSTGSGLNVPY